MMRKNFAEAEIARNVRSRIQERASSSTAEAEYYQVSEAPVRDPWHINNDVGSARELMKQIYKGRFVIKGDVREDFQQKDFDEAYADLREEYLDTTLFWEVQHELFVGGRDLRTPASSSASSVS